MIIIALLLFLSPILLIIGIYIYSKQRLKLIALQKSNEEDSEEVVAFKTEILRLKSLLQEYKDSGAKTEAEYKELDDKYISKITDYFNVKHQLDKMELWHGSYISNYSKSVGNIVSGKSANDISNYSTEMVMVQVDKSLIPQKKFKPSDLSFKELENCVNYFVENQQKLKNMPK